MVITHIPAGVYNNNSLPLNHCASRQRHATFMTPPSQHPTQHDPAKNRMNPMTSTTFDHISPLLRHASAKAWLFPSASQPVSPQAFSTALPISIHQETLTRSDLATGTTVEQLIIPSHHVESLLFGHVYASGAKFSDSQRGRRRTKSRPHSIEARFCYDTHQKEFVMVQVGGERRGAMSFCRLPNAAFRKSFFLVECVGGVVGKCSSARCVIGETGDVHETEMQASGEASSGEFVAESGDCLTAKMADLEATIKGSFFSLSSTEHILCGEGVTNRELGRELTIVGNVDAMMIPELRRFAASTHYSATLSPRVEEKMNVAVRRRLAAWRSLQRRNLRKYGEKWELRSLRGLRIALEKRYEVLRNENELLRLLLDR